MLGVLAFRGVRWAYAAFVVLGVLFFPARTGFHFDPHPCEAALTFRLALFSLTNYKHVVLFAIFFVMTAVQVRGGRPGMRVLIAFAAVLAMGIYVELAEGATGVGHCRLRDLVPDLTGALAGAVLLAAYRLTTRR